jgi:glycosyltransferase involved in cell wall biosynthesis
MSTGAGSSARVLLVVPAWNEAGGVGRVVSEARSLPERPDVLVIDDGSRDATAAVAAAAGARVARMPFNCGIGAAVQTGLRFGLERGHVLIARFDGDGQHDPHVLAALLAPLEGGSADFVLGSRYLMREGFQSGAVRRIGIRWFSWLLRLACGLHVTDPTSGCWAANRRAAEVLAIEYASDYPEVDSIVHLAKRGCRIAEVPVAMRERESGASSIAGLGALYYMLKVTLALLVGQLRGRVVRGGS